jgi:hypothetical protein
LTDRNIVNKPGLLQYLLATIIFMLIVFALVSFNHNGSVFPLLLSLVVAYSGVLYFWPRSWLLLLPSLLLLFDFSPFSGRFNFNELDILLLTTLAIGLIKDKLQVNLSDKLLCLPVLVFVILLCAIDWTRILPGLLTPHFHNPYYSLSYGFKVAKSGLYGLALALLFRHQLQQDICCTLKALLNGAVLCCFVLFVIILWEKGIIRLMLQGIEPLLLIISILDFSGSYRVTAMVSDMHTGGESIDGIFACLFPLTLAALFYNKTPLAKVIALLALACLCYSILVGYTRATYLAIAIAMVYFLSALFNQQKRHDLLNTNLIINAGLMLVSSYLVFIYVGYYAVFAVSVLITVPMLVAILGLDKPSRRLLIFVINILAMIMLIYLHFISRWITPSLSGIIILITSALVLALSSQLFVRSLPKTKRLSWSFTGYCVILLTVFVLYIASSGSQISARFSTIGNDFNSRLQHWSNVVDTGQWSLKHWLLGQTTGSFPTRYFFSNSQTIDKAGSFSINTTTDAAVLNLAGASDMIFGQRLHLSPKTDHQVTLLVKTAQKTRIKLSYCERNLILQQRYNGRCVQTKFRVEPGSQWQLISWTFNTSDIGQDHWLARAPTLFFMQNQTKDSILAVKQVSLKTTHQGPELLTNADFNQGMDNWFFYSDFEHLPWHIKNTLLEIFYNTGVIGLIAFMLILVQCYQQRESFAEPLLGRAVFTIVISWMALGLFASPLDSARASWMFYMLLFSLALGPTAKQIPIVESDP